MFNWFLQQHCMNVFDGIGCLLCLKHMPRCVTRWLLKQNFIMMCYGNYLMVHRQQLFFYACYHLTCDHYFATPFRKQDLIDIPKIHLTQFQYILHLHRWNILPNLMFFEIFMNLSIRLNSSCISCQKIPRICKIR